MRKQNFRCAMQQIALPGLMGVFIVFWAAQNLLILGGKNKTLINEIKQRMICTPSRYQEIY
jgi:hypothetical protein